MADFATIADVIALYRPLEPDERDRAEELLPIISARLRQYARNVSRDLDEMIEKDQSGVLAIVARSVTIDVLARTLQTPTTGAPMSQMSESALGYSVSGTYLVPGGGIFIKNSELRALGLLRQRYGMVDHYFPAGRNERNGYDKHSCVD